ncbi:MAG: UDP-N-acetylmuramoyl-tripeptide--D-alanyl-D-alanine ligase [Holosporaceae bacterium]|jgi:UDP-N-acetylmuramoyl-tripeptide--D-alanyl-D-alanine ligase|nr:UDP-N-acetylmuramoyl-tripeptide--D-alanyl-D-alanine ligase [Holosporaceae bacterium]
MKLATGTSAIFTREELTNIFNRDVDADVSDISINSKSTKKGDLFVAIKGKRNDAHDFVKEAFIKGCSLAIVEKVIDGIDTNKLIVVRSSCETLVDLARFNVNRVPNASYVAITGSVGKTTTKDMIYHLLSNATSNGNPAVSGIYVSKENFNSKIGLPLCVAIMPQNTKIAIFEMGMSTTGDIRNLISVVSPQASLITDICEAHLEYFPCVFDIAKAKSEIFATENPQEIAIIPHDSAYADFLKHQAHISGIRRVLSFGFGSFADARIVSCEKIKMQAETNASSEHTGWNTLRSSNLSIFKIAQNGLLEQYLPDDLENGLDITAKICGKDISYRLRSCNLSAALNSVSAILAAYVLGGVNLEKLAKIMGTFRLLAKRGDVFRIYPKNSSNRYSSGVLIMDDSYNACQTSMKTAIKSISMCRGHRKIIVIGDMLELGQRSIYFHENLSPTIDKYGIDKVFACGNFMKYLFDNLQEEKKGAWCEDAETMADVILKEVKDGDCILIKGSRSMHMDHIVDFLKNNL